jgi:hypothetical protein
MGDKLTLEQRAVVASFMEVYGSPTVVRQSLQNDLQDETHQFKR